MSALPVKGALARKVNLPPIPGKMAYPTTRQSSVLIASRVARDPAIRLTHLRVLIELAAAGASEDWIMMPTLKFYGALFGIYPTAISRAISDLIERRYLEVKPVGRQRYARIALSAYELDWE